MGNSERRIDSQSYENITFHVNILVCGDYVEENVEKDLENIKVITITDKVETISSNFYGGKTLEKLYIKNVEIASKMDIKNTEKIYVLKGQTLSSKTLENYSLSSSDSIYDIYEVK